MKHKTIITSNIEMLLVDLPEDFTKFIAYQLTSNYWQHLGKATELTEEDWKGVVDYNECPDPFLGKIKFYQKYPDSLNDNFVNTATESGLSLLKANGVILEKESIDESMFYKRHSEGLSWGDHLTMEAESKVWSNCHVFIKEKLNQQE